MELSDRLLSGKRPKAHVLELRGKTLMEQLLWGIGAGLTRLVFTRLFLMESILVQFS